MPPQFGNSRRVWTGCLPSLFSAIRQRNIRWHDGEPGQDQRDHKPYSDFRAMKNVLAGRNERSLYKLVVDAATDEVVGLHMIGPDSPEIMQAAAVAVKAKLKKADFDATVALHPTMAEELVLMR